MSGDLTAPVEFFGWTVLRAVILIPGLAIGGVKGWNLVTGALAGSTMVSLFALYRTYATKQAGKYAELQGKRRAFDPVRKRRHQPRCLKWSKSGERCLKRAAR